MIIMKLDIIHYKQLLLLLFTVLENLNQFIIRFIVNYDFQTQSITTRVVQAGLQTTRYRRRRENIAQRFCPPI